VCTIEDNVDNLATFFDEVIIADVRRAGDLNPIACETIPIYKIGSVT
jgi:hypothetical protein